MKVICHGLRSGKARFSSSDPFFYGTSFFRIDCETLANSKLFHNSCFGQDKGLPTINSDLRNILCTPTVASLSAEINNGLV